MFVYKNGNYTWSIYRNTLGALGRILNIREDKTINHMINKNNGGKNELINIDINLINNIRILPR